MADEHYPLLPDSARFNRLGGVYENGKPLPKWLRREIIALAQRGLRQCDISRRLRITHGCVSKILSKYETTGNFEPGRERAARLRIITTFRADECIQEQPGMFSSEIPRGRLCQESPSSHRAPPVTEPLQSPSSVRSPLQTGTVEQKEPTRTGQEHGVGRRSYIIANLSSNEQSTTTSQPLQQSERFPLTPLSCDLPESVYFPLPMQRRERTKYTSQQLGLLEAAFERNKYLTPLLEIQLTRDTGVPPAKIQVWFSNRRAKERKKASVAFYPDSNTQSPQWGIGNRHPDVLVPPPLSVTGPTRIYFPSGPGVNK